MRLTSGHHLWPWFCGGSLLFLLGVSVVFIAKLIQGFVIGQADMGVLSSENKVAEVGRMPEPIHTVNRRTIYQDRPDFWGWDPPWFQNIPITNETEAVPFPIEPPIFPEMAFNPNANRTTWGGDQFLLQIGDTQKSWMVAPDKGTLKIVSLDKNGISKSFTLDGMAPHLRAVTTFDLNHDGIQEILVGSPTTNTVWVFSIAADERNIALNQTFTFDSDANPGVLWVALGRFDKARNPTLLVATEYDLFAYPIEQGRIENTPARSRLASFWGIESLLVHDWTGDGEDEILIADWDSVMSLFAIHGQGLIELDHIEFPVQIFTGGRRSPTFFKQIRLDRDHKTLLVYEGFSPGRATQRFYLLDYSPQEKQLVLRSYRSPKLLGHLPRTGWETHLEDIFPIDLNGDKQDELILLHKMKGPTPHPERFRLELVRFDPIKQIWVHESDTEIAEGMDPRLGTISVGHQKIMLGYNQAQAIL